MKTVRFLLTKAIAVALLAAVACAAVLTGNTLTIYNANGFSYTLITSDKISVCGWDDSSPDFIVPDKLADKYVTEIADYALMDNSFVQSVDVTNAGHLGRIGVMAFAGCSALDGGIVIPSGISTVDLGAFQDCSAITGVKYYANIKTIAAQSFNRCSSLTAVELPMFLNKIEKLAFAGCTSLEKITIPSSVTDIDSSAFSGDDNLTIYCTKDSYAQSYAQDNNITFVLTDAYETGDADMDSDITVKDATLIQQYLAHLTDFDAQRLYLSDYDNNGRIDISDATAIQKFIAHLL